MPSYDQASKFFGVFDEQESDKQRASEGSGLEGWKFQREAKIKKINDLAKLIQPCAKVVQVCEKDMMVPKEQSKLLNQVV